MNRTIPEKERKNVTRKACFAALRRLWLREGVGTTRTKKRERASDEREREERDSVRKKEGNTYGGLTRLR